MAELHLEGPKPARMYEVILPKKLGYFGKVQEVLEDLFNEDAIRAVPFVKQIDRPAGSAIRSSTKTHGSRCWAAPRGATRSTRWTAVTCRPTGPVDERVLVIRFIFHNPGGEPPTRRPTSWPHRWRWSTTWSPTASPPSSGSRKRSGSWNTTTPTWRSGGRTRLLTRILPRKAASDLPLSFTAGVSPPRQEKGPRNRETIHETANFRSGTRPLCRGKVGARVRGVGTLPRTREGQTGPGRYLEHRAARRASGRCGPRALRADEAGDRGGQPGLASVRRERLDRTARVAGDVGGGGGQPVRRQPALDVTNPAPLTEADFARAGRHSERGPQTLAEIVALATNHVDHHLRFLYAKRANLGVAIPPRYMAD